MFENSRFFTSESWANSKVFGLQLLKLPFCLLKQIPLSASFPVFQLNKCQSHVCLEALIINGPFVALCAVWKRTKTFSLPFPSISCKYENCTFPRIFRWSERKIRKSAGIFRNWQGSIFARNLRRFKLASFAVSGPGKTETNLRSKTDIESASRIKWWPLFSAS